MSLDPTTTRAAVVAACLRDIDETPDAIRAYLADRYEPGVVDAALATLPDGDKLAIYTVNAVIGPRVWATRVTATSPDEAATLAERALAGVADARIWTATKEDDPS